MIYLHILFRAFPTQVPKLAWYLLLSAVSKLTGWRPLAELELAFRELRFIGEVGGNSGLKFAYGIAGTREYDAFPFGEVNEGDLLFDCGAHCGFFGLFYALQHPALKVVAFEPHPRTFSLLQRNIRVNGLQHRVSAIPAAVGSNNGTTTIAVSHNSTMAVVSDSCLNSATTSSSSAHEVEVLTLDSYAATQLPKFLKIDVEGYEVEALRGATRCLENAAALVLETHSPDLDRACVAILKEHHYTFARGADDDSLLFAKKQSH